MSSQLQDITNATLRQDSQADRGLDFNETASSLQDEVLVDVETANGRLVIKKSVRSGIVAIQYGG